MRCNRLLLLAAVVCLAVPGYPFAGTPDITSLVPGEFAGGWVTTGKPHVFTKETLFEHIDGQADLFLHYGFERSVFTVYRTEDSSRGKIDLDIYDVGDVLHAFGIFSRFRQDDRPTGIGLDSFVDDVSALFYKGKYFVVLQATESNPSSLKQLAQTVASRITDESLPPKEIGYFPKTGLKRGSIEYYPEGLMGRQFLKRGFKATYVATDKTGTARDAGGESPESSLFIAIFDNAGEAENALKSFREALSKKGSSAAAPSTQPGFDTLRGQDPYQGKLIIMQKGPYLVGAAGFERTKDEEGLLAELIKRID